MTEVEAKILIKSLIEKYICSDIEKVRLLKDLKKNTYKKFPAKYFLAELQKIKPKDLHYTDEERNKLDDLIYYFS